MLYGPRRRVDVYSGGDAFVRSCVARAFGGAHRRDAYLDHVVVQSRGHPHGLLLVLTGRGILAVRLEPLENDDGGHRAEWFMRWRGLRAHADDDGTVVLESGGGGALAGERPHARIECAGEDEALALMARLVTVQESHESRIYCIHSR